MNIPAWINSIDSWIKFDILIVITVGIIVVWIIASNRRDNAKNAGKYKNRLGKNDLGGTPYTRKDTSFPHEI